MPAKKTIKILKEKLDLNQAELAKQLGVAQQTISNWENLDTTPVTKKYKRIQKLKEKQSDMNKLYQCQESMQKKRQEHKLYTLEEIQNKIEYYKNKINKTKIREDKKELRKLLIKFVFFKTLKKG
jgi:transcriptional regulator with XRE-family HTH domain